MRASEQVIRDYFAHEVCSFCGAIWRPDDVLILAQRGSRWLLLVTCWRCQKRKVFIATLPPSAHHSSLIQSDSDGATLSSDSLEAHLSSHHSLNSNASISAIHPVEEAPVSSLDVDAMRQFLTNFSGDFSALFRGAGSDGVDGH